MLEDKLKATDWEATNEAIEEQVARESYIQYFRDTEKRLKDQGHPLASGSSSTITSTMVSSPRSSRRGSVSPKGCQSPKGCTSPKNLSPLGRLSSTYCNFLLKLSFSEPQDKFRSRKRFISFCSNKRGRGICEKSVQLSQKDIRTK